MTCDPVGHNLELMWQDRQSLQIAHLSETPNFCEFDMLHRPILSCCPEVALLLSGYDLVLSVLAMVFVSLCVNILTYFHLGS